MTLVAGVLIAACGSSETGSGSEALEPLVPPSKVLENLSGFAGEYVIVDSRRASDVAATLMEDLELPIGESIRFTHAGIQLTGATCDDWRVEPLDDATLSVGSDPNLSDLVIGPSDGPNSSGDQQEHQGYVVICEGEEAFRFHKVDDRVLIMPTANSAINLILEKPLSELQIKTYQMQLKTMKFYDGDLSGQLDEATLRGSRAWYEYRAQLDDSMPVPARPAITENLLDALNVIASD